MSPKAARHVPGSEGQRPGRADVDALLPQALAPALGLDPLRAGARRDHHERRDRAAREGDHLKRIDKFISLVAPEAKTFSSDYRCITHLDIPLPKQMSPQNETIEVLLFSLITVVQMLWFWFNEKCISTHFLLKLCRIHKLGEGRGKVDWGSFLFWAL